ncbi:hypothetical protein OESDEN_03832 [Oesophagostomum dentatum]|uniref:Uncharacterized protein n=1 Tax=Oesophagostomum dentatum TaxID=61180 RepID=A0A0B1TFA5_OESDE|nr:hypothetical protein OESDEN_03832 [Oesophagostomum dentatum]
MLRTPLMLSFNRNSAFISQGDRQREYMRRFLGLRNGQSLVRPLKD